MIQPKLFHTDSIEIILNLSIHKSINFMFCELATFSIQNQDQFH